MDQASSPHSCLFSILFLVFLVLPVCWSQRLLCRLCDRSRFVSRKSSLATPALSVICSAHLVQSCRSHIPIITLEIPQDMMCIHRKPGYVSMRTTSSSSLRVLTRYLQPQGCCLHLLVPAPPASSAGAETQWEQNKRSLSKQSLHGTDFCFQS